MIWLLVLGFILCLVLVLCFADNNQNTIGRLSRWFKSTVKNLWQKVTGR